MKQRTKADSTMKYISLHLELQLQEVISKHNFSREWQGQRREGKMLYDHK